MGILADTWNMTLSAISDKVSLEVCELGDQFLTEPMPRSLARDEYLKIGASRYISLDSNGLNGAMIVDLNKPLPRDLGQFDLVTDFGTGEHVFDQKTVWHSIHTLTKIGGVIAFDRPCAGYEEHCYYLINKCLIADVARDNGYEIIDLSTRDMPRGRLLRGTMRRTSKGKFVVPQQGRYRKSSKL